MSSNPKPESLGDDEALERYIRRVHYNRVKHTNTTVCTIITVCGWTTTGSSYCYSDKDFDLETGRKLAYESALHSLRGAVAFHTMMDARSRLV